MNFIRSTLAKLAAIGSVKRKGLGGLQAYGGKVNGHGHVLHKSGPKKGQKTEFELQGQPASKH